MAAAAKTTAMAWSSLLLLSTLATVHVDGASATGGGGNNAGVRGLHRRAAEPGGVPELRAGGEHSGEAPRVVLLGAQGRGEEGGGLPLPGLLGQPEPRRHPRQDQGPAGCSCPPPARLRLLAQYQDEHMET